MNNAVLNSVYINWFLDIFKLLYEVTRSDIFKLKHEEFLVRKNPLIEYILSL